VRYQSYHLVFSHGATEITEEPGILDVDLGRRIILCEKNVVPFIKFSRSHGATEPRSHRATGLGFLQVSGTTN